MSVKVKPNSVVIHCDMHRADVEARQVWTYDVKSARSDYKEHWTFCSYTCMVSWLISDDQVLRLLAKRIRLPDFIRHPEGLQKFLTEQYDESEDDDIFILGTNDAFVTKERIIPIDFNEIQTMKQARKLFTKEECDAIPSEDE